MKNRKRFLTACLSVAVLVCYVLLMPLEAEAANVVVSGECGTRGDNVTWILDDAGTLTISGTGHIKNYYFETPSPWESNKGTIKKIVVKEGVTWIGTCAFRECANLISVDLPDGLTNITDFDGCTSLQSIRIPDSVRIFGSFSGCTSLENINIPDGVRIIDGSAFRGCVSLENIAFPDSVIEIFDSAFEGCTSLTSISIPKGVTKIQYSTFEGCTSLTSVVIPDSVTEIEFSAFEDCTGLTSVTIPNTVTEIGYNAFKNCTGLTEIILPNSVTKIAGSAFEGCTGLKSVTIPASMAEIGNRAFFGCNNLQTVKYSGTAAQWARIGMGSFNEPLLLAYQNASCTHKWDGGTVTKQASCSAAGEKTFTCTLCSQTKAETVAKLAHTYTNNCDASCNVCSESRSVSHTYDTKWSSDAANHWHTCTSCGEKKDTAKHTPGAEATETTAQTCTTCGYVLKAALGHTHAYGSDWKSDANNHWHVCACGAKADEAVHTWDSGKTNTDGSKLFTCTACKATKTEAAPSGGGSSGNGGTTGSGNTDTPGTGDSSDGNNSTDTPTNTPSDTPADNDGKENGGNSTVIIIVAAVAILGGGGAVAGLVLGKKKK